MKFLFAIRNIPIRFIASLMTGLLLSQSAASDQNDRGLSPAIDLEAAENSVFSQFGEDGVIEKIFEIIEPGPKYCVEFGAHDGINNSNMRNLILNHGWSSYQIEGDPNRAARLAENYKDYPSVRTQHAWVWPGNIEILFEEAGVPKDLDLLVIDIDSNDYYVWRAIHDFRPKVVVIEMNAFFPPPQLMVIDYHPMNYWDRTYYTGASIQSLYELGKKKGYELIYQLSRGPNVIFVDKQYFERFGIPNNSPAKIYRTLDPKIMSRQRAHYGQNGVPWPTGKDVLTWKDLTIKKKFLFNR